MTYRWRNSVMAVFTGVALMMTVPALAADIKPVAADVPQGAYKLDKTHASLLFRVKHLGMSNYTARFIKFDADLFLDPKAPAASSLTATVDATSLETDFPLPTPDFNGLLRGEQWLDTSRYPEITFKSTEIELVSPNRATVTGDLTLRGQTRSVTLDVTYNGGYASNPHDPGGARIGFSAKGRLKRSEFGISMGIPEPGTTMGVSDDVEIILETEFSKSAK